MKLAAHGVDSCPCPVCVAVREHGRLTRIDAIRSAMYWLGRGVRRLAGIDPFPTERSN